MFESRDFADLVEEAEREARESPGLYRFKCGALAVLGCVFPVVLLVLIGALARVGWSLATGDDAGTVWRLIGSAFVLLMGYAAWQVLGALSWRIEPPAGHEVTRAEAPRLFDEIERARRTAGAAPLDKVVIDHQFNAGVVDLPRFGIFGSRHVLQLGLPLLATLGVDELRSVLGHEFAHLARRHARFTTWVYRVRRGVPRVLGAMGDLPPALQWVVHLFYRWFEPEFLAYSFVLAREHEIEADAVGARAGSPAAAGAALCRLAALARWVDTDLPEIRWRAALNHALPREREMHEFIAAIPSCPAEQQARELAKAGTARREHDDTHPPLGVRLAALGARTALPSPVEPAIALLGTARERVFDAVDKLWRRGCCEQWRQHHLYLQRQARRGKELTEAAKNATLQPGEPGELLAAVIAVNGAAAGLRAAVQLNARYPHDARLLLEHGRLLYITEQADAADRLEQALRLDPRIERDALETLVQLHADQGNRIEMDRCAARLARLDDEETDAARAAAYG